MSALLFLIPVALFLGGLGLVAFLWSLRSGQYEDLEGAANRILIEDGDRPLKDKTDDKSPQPTRDRRATE